MRLPPARHGCTLSLGMRNIRRGMQPKITYNAAWESIPLSAVDGIIDFFNRELQPGHPLRSFKLFPVAKCWRRFKYLVEEEEPSDLLWVLDMDRKKRIRGKTCYYFRLLETQDELDAMLQADYEWWVQYMKDAGAWEGE
jgi:hypothetical protein